MKLNLLYLFTVSALLAATSSARAADTNSPPRLTVELRDGSRVIGTSAEQLFYFHSALLGDVKLPVKDIRSLEWVATNALKLKAVNGDTLMLQPAHASLVIQTGFGKVELACTAIRKLSVAATAISIPARDGVIGFWPGNGSAADAVGTNNGVLLGDANFAPGLAGPAFNFDGPGSGVKIPNAPALNPGRQITIEFWMKPAADNAMNNYQGLVTSDFYGVEISNGYGGKMGVNFFISPSSSPSLRRFGLEDQRLSGFRSRITTVADFAHSSDVNGGGAPVSADSWHHVAGSYDGTKLWLFIDGQSWGNPRLRSGTVPPMLPESFVTIGSEDGRTTCPECVGNRYFKGLISQVAIYNRALSPAEIMEDYQSGNSN